MPQWEGIEDATAKASRVWLTRPKLTDQNKNNEEDRIWKPLRKVDCEALNRAPSSEKVYIYGGRCTADPVENTVQFNFFRGVTQELASATWFTREEKGKDKIVLTPVRNPLDCDRIEALYQKGVEASSSLGKGIASVLDQEVHLSDESKIKIQKTGGMLTIRKTPPGWFSSSLMLQRGYGEYTVEGEHEELSLGPVRHVVFVVHGIGETMFSREDISLPGMIEQMNITRVAFQKKQIKTWKEECEKANRSRRPPPPPPSRVEFIPIEWWSQLHDSSTELMKSIGAITLPTIPALREIANDIVIDVLLYLLPNFAQSVLETCISQINQHYRTFQKIHSDFVEAGGSASLIGHSLGSVICWDMLSILKESLEDDNQFTGVTFKEEEVGYHAYAKREHAADKAKYGSFGPSLVKPIEEVLAFTPSSTIFLGSPVGLFLTFRGAHAVFDNMRSQSTKDSSSEGTSTGQDKLPKTSPFTLPTGKLFNIFNPSDPVAYRIEPLLLPQDMRPEDIEPPRYLTPPGKDVRLHVKARQVSETIRKSITEPRSSFGFLMESAVAGLSEYAKTIQDEQNQTIVEKAASKDEVLCFALANPSQYEKGLDSGRVDYQFQPSVIDNEYLSAVLAHSTSNYFLNEDFLDLLMQEYSSKPL